MIFVLEKIMYYSCRLKTLCMYMVLMGLDQTQYGTY